MNTGGSKNKALTAKIMMVLSMTVFGTIGLFRRFIPLPSGMIAFFRGLIGTLALLLVMLILRKKPNAGAIRKNLLKLIISGAFIGFNWILLFEAYNYTSVATATLCYYMAPMIVIALSPFVLRERITLRQGICVLAALVGAVLVSGVVRGGAADLRGILFALGAAALYATVILINKRLDGIDAYDKTTIQLASATAVILPYTLIAEEASASAFTPTVIVLLFVVGIVHTGLAYSMYFGAVGALRAQTVAIFSYIDPVVAVVLSATVLREPTGVLEIFGAVLIIGAAIVGELSAS